jgi:hypothetical protein
VCGRRQATETVFPNDPAFEAVRAAQDNAASSYQISFSTGTMIEGADSQFWVDHLTSYMFTLKAEIRAVAGRSDGSRPAYVIPMLL